MVIYKMDNKGENQCSVCLVRVASHKIRNYNTDTFDVCDKCYSGIYQIDERRPVYPSCPKCKSTNSTYKRDRSQADEKHDEVYYFHVYQCNDCDYNFLEEV